MKRGIRVLSVLYLVMIVAAGCGSSSSPEECVRSFLDEINKGNTETAKEYFSGEYSSGYDRHDKRKLEQNFPPAQSQR